MSVPDNDQEASEPKKRDTWKEKIHCWKITSASGRNSSKRRKAGIKIFGNAVRAREKEVN